MTMRRQGEVFLASSAIVSGEVSLAPGVNLWYGVVVRGDVAPITLMENVNLQDGVIVHCDFDVPNVIEPGVVVGHAAVLHGRRVEEDCLIGIGAKLLSDSVIGPESIVAAGTVVPPGLVVPPRSLVMGIPGKVVRAARPEEIEKTKAINRRYREMALRYAEGRITWPLGTPTESGGF
jgi:carbonic anhydrase/acetyltransferase-like protein (isoleucine patch superfamily)